MPDTSSQTVLVVNDDPAQLALLAGLLRKDGFSVRTADDAARAREQVPGCDLAVLDMHLPDQDGDELLAWLRQVGHKLPVILISATAPDRERAERIAACDGLLLAPYRPAEVRGRIKSLLRPEAPGPDRPAADPLDRLEQAGGRALLTRVAGIFLERAPGNMEALEQAAASRDLETAERIAHSLKGSAAMLGAKDMAQLCQHLEDAAARGSLARRPPELERLRLAFEEARLVITRRLV